VSFDSFAAAYDQTFGLSPTGRLFRFRLAERVMSASRPPAQVLDIGCGTGEDALWLAASGYSVHGIDDSPKMIEVARAKAESSGSSATFECRSVRELAREPERFDVVLSNFGALNCVPVETWAAITPALLTSSGRGFVVLMGRRPLPEGVRRGFAAADRGGAAQVRVGASSLTVHYESAAVVERALSTSALVTRVEALGCLVPGPGYRRFVEHHPLFVGLLAMAESMVRRAPFFKGRGDHTLFEFQR
jgi:SAM-dependent methyltransferase